MRILNCNIAMIATFVVGSFLALEWLGTLVQADDHPPRPLPDDDRPTLGQDVVRKSIPGTSFGTSKFEKQVYRVSQQSKDVKPWSCRTCE